VVGVIVALALVIAFFPWRILRAPLESHLSSVLDRPVTIGALAVEPGRVTRVQLDDVTIANAPWAKEQPMARADSAVMYFTLGALLRMRPDYVQLVKPDALLERNAQGDANWRFDDGEDRLSIEAVDIDAGKLRYRDPAARADVSVAISTQAIEGQAALLRFSGRGTLRGEALTLDGQGGGVNALRRTGEPYPLKVRARQVGDILGAIGDVKASLNKSTHVAEE